MRGKYRLGLLFVILLSCIVLYLRHGKLLTATPDQVLQGYGDAFNAYNLVHYHAKYDSTYTVFEGMAYPYGDHVTIASTIPLVSNGLKFFKDMGMDFTHHSSQVLHLSILLSYIVCAVFLYLIFSRLAFPPWYGLIIAVALTFMSPQTERLYGHLGLAHLYAIPATIYFLLLFDERPRWWVSVCLFLTVALTSLLQFYFFAITAFMIAGFYFFSFLKKASPSENDGKWIFPKADFIKYALHFSVQVILPYLLFLWWFAQYDVPHRPDKPYGYLLFVSYWEGLFVSMKMPFYQWIDKYVIPVQKVDFEGIAYTGMVAFGIFLSMLIFWIRHLFRKSFFQKLTIVTTKKAEKVSDNELAMIGGLQKQMYDDADFLKRLFAMAVVLVIFSAGYPFALPNMEFLLDYAGPIKQFRSVARFNWIFFFVLNIIAFTYLHRKFRHTPIWLILPLALLVYESWQYNHARPYNIDSVTEFKTGKSFQDKSSIDFSNYQALLPIPYFNIGTDNFDATLQGRIQQKSIALSMETGLPSMASMGNRSSVSRAYKLFQTVAEPYQIPSILTDFKNEKPILLMVDTSYMQRFPYLEEGTKFLEAVDAMRFYELPLNAFQTRIDNRKEEIQKRIQSDSLLFRIGDFRSTDSTQSFIYQNFDNQKSTKAYKGTGALELDITTPQTIFKEELSNFKKGDKAVLSFWCDLSQYPAATTFVQVKLRHPITKEIAWQSSPQIRYLIPVMDNNNWALFELPFEVKENGILEISVVNEGMKNRPFYVDELLIRRAGVDLYMDAKYNKNNRWY